MEECLRWLDEHPEVERRSVLPHRDRLLAMLGRFDEAHRLLAEAADRTAELGVVRFRTWLALRRFEVAMLKGDAPRAEVAARETCETAQASAALGNFMWFCCNLAQALLGLGRDDEAEQWLERGRETAPSDEPLPQMLWRQVRGKVLAVLALAGHDASSELDRALALYERKGNLVMAKRTRSRLAELTAPR